MLRSCGFHSYSYLQVFFNEQNTRYTNFQDKYACKVIQYVIAKSVGYRNTSAISTVRTINAGRGN